MTLGDTPLFERFGVEVQGVDLKAAAAGGGFAEIEALFSRHSVVLFRDQELTSAALVAFSRRFGALETPLLNQFTLADARAEIFTTYERIEAFTGTRPVGWLGAGIEETWNSLDYLIDAGAPYGADWICDDQPYLMDVGGRRIVSTPYSFETNDINFIYRKFEPAVFERMIRDQFDTLYREGAETGRVMAICLHPWVVGMPHRIGYLDSALEYICRHEGVWKATDAEIARHYLDSGAAASSGYAEPGSSRI